MLKLLQRPVYRRPIARDEPKNTASGIPSTNRCSDHEDASILKRMSQVVPPVRNPVWSIRQTKLGSIFVGKTTGGCREARSEKIEGGFPEATNDEPRNPSQENGQITLACEIQRQNNEDRQKRQYEIEDPLILCHIYG